MINGSIVLTVVIDVVIVDINLLIFIVCQEKLACHLRSLKWDHRLSTC